MHTCIQQMYCIHAHVWISIRMYRINTHFTQNHRFYVCVLRIIKLFDVFPVERSVSLPLRVRTEEVIDLVPQVSASTAGPASWRPGRMPLCTCHTSWSTWAWASWTNCLGRWRLAFFESTKRKVGVFFSILIWERIMTISNIWQYNQCFVYFRVWSLVFNQLIWWKGRINIWPAKLFQLPNTSSDWVHHWSFDRISNLRINWIWGKEQLTTYYTATRRHTRSRSKENSTFQVLGCS